MVCIDEARKEGAVRESNERPVEDAASGGVLQADPCWSILGGPVRAKNRSDGWLLIRRSLAEGSFLEMEEPCLAHSPVASQEYHQ